MTNKRVLAFLPFILFTCILWAQQPVYVRAKIDLREKDFRELARLGIEVEHGDFLPNTYFISEFSPEEMELIRQAGFSTEILIPDVTRWFLEQSQRSKPAETRNSCAGNRPYYEYPNPVNYVPGSMNGYFTYQEILDNLDKMRALYPGLISARAKCSDTIVTHEGRPIWYVQISDSPDAAEAGEPKIMFNALHHAREANSVSQLLFFMWHLLENYHSDAKIKYLLDNTALYFVPVVNPDGYTYNESIAPQGGGFWRKNRRNNGNGTYGVDLNRNYGFHWGEDNTGSSPNPNSETYRGPAPFSEPETRTIRDFCKTHLFDLVFNYHTRGNLLIYPFSYNELIADPDLEKLGGLLRSENNFFLGTTFQALNYTVNGNSDDWMYAETGSFTYTPEVGEPYFGFWPPESEIDRLNKSTMRQNVAAAYSVFHYGEAVDIGAPAVQQYKFELPFRLTRYGALDGPLTVSLEPLSAEVQSVSSPQTFTVNRFASAEGKFTVQCSAFENVEFFLTVSHNNVKIWKEKVERQFSTPIVKALNEKFDTNLIWSADGCWEVRLFKNSPQNERVMLCDYIAGFNFSELSPVNAIPIPANAVNPVMRFRALWHLQDPADFVRLYGGESSFEKKTLCSQYTREYFDGEPAYTGVNSRWVWDEVDLSEYKGKLFYPNFTASGSNSYYFVINDLEIEYGLKINVDAQEPDWSAIALGPNPASDFVMLYGLPDNTAVPLRARVTDILGKAVFEAPISGSSLRIDTRGLPSGVYQCSVSSPGGTIKTMKFSVQN